MDDSGTSFYKGYAFQALIYKHETDVRPRERTYEVSVRIGLEDEPWSSGKVYKVAASSPFLNLGDARRAAVERAHVIINGKIARTSRLEKDTATDTATE